MYFHSSFQSQRSTNLETRRPGPWTIPAMHCKTTMKLKDQQRVLKLALAVASWSCWNTGGSISQVNQSDCATVSRLGNECCFDVARKQGKQGLCLNPSFRSSVMKVSAQQQQQQQDSHLRSGLYTFHHHDERGHSLQRWRAKPS